MKPRYRVSSAGVELIKTFEGYRPESAQLADGRWTIGYGHTKTARRGATVSEDDAAALLTYDLMPIVAALNDLIYTPLTQNQFDALVSFAFNVGLDAFRKSIVLRRVNEGSMLQAAWSLEMWRKADFEGERIVVDALVRRRAAEKALFLTPSNGWVAAPSPVLPPRFDAEIAAGVPSGEPVELKASLEGGVATVVREASAAELDAGQPSVDARLNAAATEVAQVVAAPLAEPGIVVPQTAETIAPPSASSKLADASEVMSARLEAILPKDAAAPVVSEPGVDLELPAPPQPAAPVAAETPASVAAPTEAQYDSAVLPERAPEPDLFGRPRHESRWPNPIAFTPPAPDEAPSEPVAAFADLFQRPIYREEPTEELHHFDTAQLRPLKFGFAPYLLTGLVGLILFAAATTWAFGARGRGAISPLMVGVPLAVVGIACVAWSVYALISRFSDREE